MIRGGKSKPLAVDGPASVVDLSDVLRRVARETNKLDVLSGEVETGILRIAESCAPSDVPSRELQMMDRLRQDLRDLASFTQAVSEECSGTTLSNDVFSRLLLTIKQVNFRQGLRQTGDQPALKPTKNNRPDDLTLF